MHLRFVFKQLGRLVAVLGLLLAAVAAFSGIQLLLGHKEEKHALFALLLAAAVAIAIAAALWAATRSARPQLGRREALVLVALSWLLGAALAGLPYLFWAYLAGEPHHRFGNPFDCYFEAMSGLTTTGATVLGGDWPIESIPPSLLLWRAFTQWIGGLGIVVLFVAVLPSLGVGGKKLFRIEAPGPAPEGLQPQIRHTARVLLYIYFTLTAAQFVCLWVAGMPAYDAACHTFTTLATGGFSTRDQSIGYYPAAVHVIVIVFMVLAGVNFSLYFAVVRRKLSSVWRDPELRTYLVLMTVGSILVAGSLAGGSITTTTGEIVTGSAGEAIHYGLFTTVALSTGTGYCIADFDKWPFMAKAVLIVLMFIGGSAGSTAGGIKVIRIWMAFKVMISEIEHVFRPQVVRTVRVGNTIIDNNLKLGTLAYVLGIILLFAVGSAAVMLLETILNPAAGCDYTTAATASLASLCNVGPGFGAVGATANYGWMTSYTKMVLSLLMALGRLEVFAIIVLFTPRFWTTE